MRYGVNENGNETGMCMLARWINISCSPQRTIFPYYSFALLISSQLTSYSHCTITSSCTRKVSAANACPLPYYFLIDYHWLKQTNKPAQQQNQTKTLAMTAVRQSYKRHYYAEQFRLLAAWEIETFGELNAGAFHRCFRPLLTHLTAVSLKSVSFLSDVKKKKYFVSSLIAGIFTIYRSWQN